MLLKERSGATHDHGIARMTRASWLMLPSFVVVGATAKLR